MFWAHANLYRRIRGPYPEQLTVKSFHCTCPAMAHISWNTSKRFQSHAAKYLAISFCNLKLRTNRGGRPFYTTQLSDCVHSFWCLGRVGEIVHRKAIISKVSLYFLSRHNASFSRMAKMTPSRWERSVSFHTCFLPFLLLYNLMRHLGPTIDKKLPIDASHYFPSLIPIRHVAKFVHASNR